MQAWGITDVGMVRAENQDSHAIEQLEGGAILAVVCDGMGGARSGSVASRLAMNVFLGEVRRSWRENLSEEKTAQLLREALELANTAVFEQSCESDEFRGMGTTLVAAIVTAQRADLINVGDSRAYHISAEGIRCVTTDHSFVQMMVQRGELTEEQAKNHPQKNLITRAIGTESAVEGDVFHLPYAAGESIFLCSDGVSNLLADQEILFEVLHGVRKEDCCQRLLEITKQRGAPDNATMVLIVG